MIENHIPHVGCVKCGKSKINLQLRYCGRKTGMGEVLKILETDENVEGQYVTQVRGTCKCLLVEIKLKLLAHFVNFRHFEVLQFKVICIKIAEIILSNPYDAI